MQPPNGLSHGIKCSTTDVLSYAHALIYTVVKPAVQNTCKRCRFRKCFWGHIPMPEILAIFIYIFLPVLSRPSFTSRTPNKDQKLEQFYFLFVQVLYPGDFPELCSNLFCAGYPQVFAKCASRIKWETLVPLDRFP